MKRISIKVFFLTLILIGIGFVMIFSSSSPYAKELYNDQFYFFKHHLINFIVGLTLQLMVMKFDYRKYTNMSGILLVLSIMLLLLVFMPGIGYSVRGSCRWITFGPIRFQPSEFVKIAMLIYFADYIEKKKDRIKSFVSGLLPALFIIGVIGGLILKQPDFGTTVIFCSVTLMLLFISGVKWSYLAALFLAAIPLLYIAVWKTQYRRRRIVSFLNPWGDPNDGGYQIIQSLIALGSGGLLGVGLGQR